MNLRVRIGQSADDVRLATAERDRLARDLTRVQTAARQVGEHVAEVAARADAGEVRLGQLKAAEQELRTRP